MRGACYLGQAILQIVSDLHADRDIRDSSPLVHQLSFTVCFIRGRRAPSGIEDLWQWLHAANPVLFNGGQQDVWDAFFFLVEEIDE